jgi:hypothetical protein
MQDKVNKPIFVLGSPRSGTSILTWCLGQHPNIVPLPESGWMGDFAIDLAIRYQIGAARGNRSVLSAMDIQFDEFVASFGQTIDDLIWSHRNDLERKRDLERKLRGDCPSSTSGTASSPETRCSEPEPKTRWVDGTPQNSLHIYGLRKLFPDALFIHLLRDVSAVVRSMLNFYRVAGIQLVANEEEAYKYWLRMVSACLKAEQAYGPRVIYRLPYAALIDNPESAIRALLDFVGEPYTADCLEPLAQRINSSNVPVDFNPSDPATDPAIVEEARQLSDRLQSSPQPGKASAQVAEKLEAEFNERVRYFYDLETTYSDAQKLIAKLQEERELLNASPAGGKL